MRNRGGQVKVWQLPERRQLVTIEGHNDTVQALAFSPDGKTLATASYDKDIKLWDRCHPAANFALSGTTSTPSTRLRTRRTAAA